MTVWPYISLLLSVCAVVARAGFVTNNNFGTTVGRAGLSVLLYVVNDCPVCNDVLSDVLNVADRVRAERIGAFVGVVNVSDRQSIVRGNECDPDRLGLRTFPALRIAHFGRINRNVHRVPRTQHELFHFVAVMAQPSSVELDNVHDALTTLEAHASTIPVVMGFFGDRESQYRLEEMAQSFRGHARFFHIGIQLASETLIELSTNATYRARYSALLRGQAPPRRDTFIVVKQQFRDGEDIFGPSSKRARKALKTLTGGTREREQFDPLRADGGFAAEPPLPPMKPTPVMLRRGGATAWYFSPVVDFRVSFPDHVGALDLLDRQELMTFIARHVFPPVNVLTLHNREHFNLRTPFVFFVFSKDVSQSSADYAQTERASAMHGFHEERAFLLERPGHLRYVAKRLETLSDEFWNYTFVFASLEDNRQVFSQFGVDLDLYDQRTATLFGVLHGEKKYTYVNASRFDLGAVRTWLAGVEAGAATPFVKSSHLPVVENEPDAGALTTIAYSNFDSVVLQNRTREVLVLFVQEGPRFRTIVKSYQTIAVTAKHPSLLFTVFDASNNDPPDNFGFDSLPSLFFFPTGEAHATQYDGDFSAKSMTAFLQHHSMAFDKEQLAEEKSVKYARRPGGGPTFDRQGGLVDDL